jgi:glycosyltransferase involved in cell wall biosynthesis
MLKPLRRRAIDLATKTPLRHVAGPVYARIVATELAAERARDQVHLVQEPIPGITVLIKTFERAYVCARLLASVRRRFPTIDIVVVDDSKRPRHWEGARTVVLPYDAGASAGRNEGLKHVDTDLFLLLDDDNIVYRRTDLARAVTFMRAHPEVDIYAGQVFMLPFFERSVAPFDRDCFGGPLGSIGGLPVYDRTDQFFVGRTRRIAAVGWEPRLKTAEHTEFFWRSRGRLTAVFDEQFRVLHAKTPFDVEYMTKRSDIGPYVELLRELMK